ncbi:magnesium/cobalt transporter CorA [Zeaxanthinibacter enoshimensis]|uniref:magnesium/cobalt transporter CorA n=1 Tax=Zeaxanthinibacter enoshimensis TaxID=392009 RepID=UPI00356394C4
MTKRKIRRKLNIKTRAIRPRKIAQKKGKQPGAIIYVGDRGGMASSVNIMEYNWDQLQEYSLASMTELEKQRDSNTNSWIDIIGISDEKFIEDLGKKFEINNLALEDAINTQQRPKIDEYDNYIFGVFKMLYLDENQQLVVEHIALTLFEHNVLVFQELKGDVFNGVRERLRNRTGKIRAKGADYLFFALIDAVVDSYFEVSENIFERIDTLEDEVYYDPKPDTARKIQELKKEVIRMHKWIFPVKEMIHRLIETDNPMISKDTRLYLRDALDHCIEINETLQIYREMSISLMEMYMTSVSNKMNEVMKVLTIMASIFIPLTFIAGIYGMNFEYMPELNWRYGYSIVLALMLIILVGMLIFFKKKRWI